MSYILALYLTLYFLIPLCNNALSVCVLTVLLAAQSEQRECAYAEQPQAQAERIENATVRCNHGGHCFGLWWKKNNEIQLVKQGI